MEKKLIRDKKFSGERALFHSTDLRIEASVFEDGESPLKESSDLELEHVLFRWKYPLWYCKNVIARQSCWFDMARAGVWYTEGMRVEDCVIQAPKNFRRCRDLSIRDTAMTDAKETLWSCQGVKLANVTARGDYFAMNSSGMEIDNLILDGNYSFDGVRDVTIRNSRLLSKDAFWNSENVTVYDSFISGEYLGWNSKKLTLINCTIESLQGMCYIEELVMKDCRLVDTTLAFEYSSADVSVNGRIESVFNPKSGTIRADEIGELIIEKDEIDPSRTKIVCEAVEVRSDAPEWKRGTKDV
ncbi:MAG: DUF3737 family protein [Lachnospiraceae bacterium]|nr:DUF3737 family protein [Lachnospiraceae bacterium]